VRFYCRKEAEALPDSMCICWPGNLFRQYVVFCAIPLFLNWISMCKCVNSRCIPCSLTSIFYQFITELILLYSRPESIFLPTIRRRNVYIFMFSAVMKNGSRYECLSYCHVVTISRFLPRRTRLEIANGKQTVFGCYQKYHR
jgi:hypothetical protein